MAKVWDKPITADTDWGGDASTENLPVSGRQVQAWIKSNIKSDAQISQLIVSWLNKNTINSPAFWKGLPIDADTLKWENNTLTVIGSDGETEAVIDEEFLINFLKENGYLTKGDYPFVYDAEKKVWLFTGDLITTGAITMFGSIEGFTPSTIMDAVQVDGRTIVKNAAGQLVAIGGGGSGGGLMVDDVNALIEAALVPVQEEIGLKWTEDSDSIYRWNLAFSWGDHSKEGYALKSYVDDEFTKYILLDTAQDVNAQHNFKKGLFIDGLPITKVNSNTIFLDANLVVGGAITMFGNNSSTFKAIWENIPFDSTMQWNGSAWSVVGGGGSSINEAAVNLLIGEYLTNNNYASEQWVSNQGFAKQSSLDGVDNRLKSVETFFATSDTDNLVNKWSEIVTFLNATEGDTLDNILKTKANQSALDDAVASLNTEIGKKWTQNDVKIANWDSAYGWGNHANAGYAAKTYVDGELAKYVKLATAQTISARHNFSDGLQIGGITIRKSQDGVVYVDGNLVIKGALTMFGTDATIPSSIWASIPFDLNTMEWTGSVWRVKGDGTGSVDDATVRVIVNEVLGEKGYATEKWVTDKDYATVSVVSSAISSALDGYATQGWVEGKKYLTGITSSQVTTALGYTPYNSSNPDKYIKGIDYDMVIAALGYTPYSTTNPMGYLTISSLLGYATEQWVGDNYLSNSGGTISGNLDVNSQTDTTIRYLRMWYYGANRKNRGMLRVNENNVNLSYYSPTDGISAELYIGRDGFKYGSYDVIHSNNIGSYKAGSADAVTINYSQSDANYNLLFTNQADQWVSKVDAVYRDNRNKLFYNPSTGALTATSFVGNLTGNAESATKLATARTIWGQGFDGTGNVYGSFHTTDNIFLNSGGEGIYISANSISWHNSLNSWTNGLLGFIADGTVIAHNKLAVGGTTADAKLHVHGDILSKGSMRCVGDYGGFAMYAGIRDGEALAIERLANHGGWVGMGITMLNNGNVVIGGTTADAKLHVYGDILATGAITMFSQLSMKNVIDYDGLSLEQLAHIKPARFTWKDGRDSLVHAGGIADEVMQVLPEVIHCTSDDKLTMDYGSAAFYVGASLIKPVIDHEKRIAELERENKRKDEVIVILQNKLNQLSA